MQPAYTPEGTESNSSTPTDNPLQIQLFPSRAALSYTIETHKLIEVEVEMLKDFFFNVRKRWNFFGDYIIFIHPLNQNRKAKF